MKKIKKLLVFSCLITGTVIPSLAQKQESKKEMHSRYSRWSLGANGGISIFRGDMISFSADKTYIGGQGGWQLGYQFTPTFGLSLTGDLGVAKGSAKKWEKNYIIYPDGNSYYGTSPESGFAHYNDIYSKVKYFMLGLHADFNANNFFGHKEMRRWTVILSPAVYLQKFSPKLYLKDGDQRFDKASTLNNDINLGLGGDLILRYRTGKHVDLQLKSGVTWIDNNNFDGIATCCTSKYNWLANLSIGVTWKIGNKKKKENLIYASTRAITPVVPPVVKEQPSPLPETKQETRPTVKENTTPVEEVVKIQATEGLPNLPTIHFKRNSATIDTIHFAPELSRIEKALKAFPKVNVNIRGYADHTGTDKINLTLSLKRAEALRDYLIKKGIPSNRMKVFGEGKDKTVDQKDIYSEKARKVKVTKQE